MNEIREFEIKVKELIDELKYLLMLALEMM